jgi:hypothetical protein
MKAGWVGITQGNQTTPSALVMLRLCYRLRLTFRLKSL